GLADGKTGKTKLLYGIMANRRLVFSYSFVVYRKRNEGPVCLGYVAGNHGSAPLANTIAQLDCAH
ncbi:hypothetical protein KHT87_21190, partial [Alkalihalobacillus clausii]|uniref:hypothetical protein n=1 Tax=Shouchella clausii TaxID=79880 RepID=UPI001C0DC354